MRTPEEKRARYEQLVPHLHDTQMGVWRMVDEGMMRAACGVMGQPGKCTRFLPRDDDSIAVMLNYCCFNLFGEGGRTLMDHTGVRKASVCSLRQVRRAERPAFDRRTGRQHRDRQTIDVLARRYPELRGGSSQRPTPGPSPAPRFGQPPAPGGQRVGRNDPCPCGSGKKFKQCCLGRN
jgi:hypothetical protein